MRIRHARERAGLSQSRLADLSGIPQPNISAYESRVRIPRPETVEKLLRAARRRPSEVLFENRQAVLELAARRHLGNVRVFGSSVHGADTPDSDVDLLVQPDRSASLFDLAGFADELKELLGNDVDVVSDVDSDGRQNPVLDRIRAEALPL